MQHDFLHLSLFQDDFREFVDTLMVALRQIEKSNNPLARIHPVVLTEAPVFDAGSEGKVVPCGSPHRREGPFRGPSRMCDYISSRAGTSVPAVCSRYGVGANPTTS